MQTEYCPKTIITELFFSEATLPEKKWAISSLEQPNGKPRNLTTASIFACWFGPFLFTTHSISLRFDRKTRRKKKQTLNDYSLFFSINILLALFGTK